MLSLLEGYAFKIQSSLPVGIIYLADLILVFDTIYIYSFNLFPENKKYIQRKIIPSFVYH